MRQSMCTHTAHTGPTTEIVFHQKNIFWKNEVCVPHVCTCFVSLIISDTKKVQRGVFKIYDFGLKKGQIFKNTEFLIVGCYKSVPSMCRYIIFNKVGYIHSINTFLRQKVCAHKRHSLMIFFRTVCKKTPKLCAVCVHILFVSQMSLLSVYIPHY